MQNWVCQCPLAQMFFALRKGCEMSLVSVAGASLGLAVRWQRQDHCSYLCAIFSGWTLQLVIPPAPLGAAAWPSGLLLLLLDGGQRKPACCFPSCQCWSMYHALCLWHLPGGASICILILVFSLWSALLVLLVSPCLIHQWDCFSPERRCVLSLSY